MPRMIIVAIWALFHIFFAFFLWGFQVFLATFLAFLAFFIMISNAMNDLLAVTHPFTFLSFFICTAERLQ